MKVIEIEIPPLRERFEDILPLTYYYLSRFDKQFNKIHSLSAETTKLLLSYHWPGNVRELKHTTELLSAIVDNGEIRPADLPVAISRQIDRKVELDGKPIGLEDAIEALTRKLIVEAYNMLKSSYKVAAFLNISQSKAHRLIRRYIGPSRTTS